MTDKLLYILAVTVIVISLVGMVFFCFGCQTTSQGQLPSEVMPLNNPKGGMTPETPIIHDDWERFSGVDRSQGNVVEPEVSPSVQPANSTTVLLDPSPAPREMVVGASSVSLTNDSQLIKSLPHRRFVRPRNMTDEQWSDFLKSRQ